MALGPGPVHQGYKNCVAKFVKPSINLFLLGIERSNDLFLRRPLSERYYSPHILSIFGLPFLIAALKNL
jgi:hypothetical protein